MEKLVIYSQIFDIFSATGEYQGEEVDETNTNKLKETCFVRWAARRING